MSGQHPLNEELITESAGKQRTSCMSPPLSIDGTDRRTDGRTPDRYTDAYRILRAVYAAGSNGGG